MDVLPQTAKSQWVRPEHQKMEVLRVLLNGTSAGCLHGAVRFKSSLRHQVRMPRCDLLEERGYRGRCALSRCTVLVTGCCFLAFGPPTAQGR